MCTRASAQCNDASNEHPTALSALLGSSAAAQAGRFGLEACKPAGCLSLHVMGKWLSSCAADNNCIERARSALAVLMRQGCKRWQRAWLARLRAACAPPREPACMPLLQCHQRQPPVLASKQGSMVLALPCATLAGSRERWRPHPPSHRGQQACSNDNKEEEHCHHQQHLMLCHWHQPEGSPSLFLPFSSSSKRWDGQAFACFKHLCCELWLVSSFL